MDKLTEEQRLTDEEFIRWCNGLYAGQLSPAEMETFERLIEAGRARRVYRDVAGFLGLAKVEVIA